MVPTLRSGDTVLARRAKVINSGDVVLVRWASRPGQLSVKRAVHQQGSGWYVLGDNEFGSTDSRDLGPAEVLGVIRSRLWPNPGRLPAR
jgi:phage repressor protein C with HTH and peptisase S24 domain